MRDRTDAQIELVLIRHGETEANLAHRYEGRTDEPLAKEGIRKLCEKRAAGCYPGQEDVAVVFASPMLRCVQTAELLFPAHRIRRIGRLREIDFGEWEGKRYRELAGDARYQAWIDSGGTLPFPGGESREAFVRRCAEGLAELLSDEAVRAARGSVPRIALVAHGGTVMALLSRYGGGEYFSCGCKNGESCRCRVCFCREPDGVVRPEQVRIRDVRRD